MTKETTKTEKVFLRMSPKDKATLITNAKKQGKSMSDYIRAKTL
jgi:predicted HicB family RNase H-like nuclease